MAVHASLPRSRHRLVPTAAAVLATLAILGVACTPPGVNPDGSVPQNSPVGVNGMVQEVGAVDGDVWGADLFGGQLVRFDADTGAVAERYGMQEGLCGTDDVVVMPDTSLVATCPADGTVIRVPRGGTAEVLARVGRGVNPIAVEPSSDPTLPANKVLVGFGTDEHDELLRVPVDGGPVEVVADGLPVLNGFGFGPDGILYVPTGGVGGIFGTGGVGRIDPSTGGFTELTLTFAEPGKVGFDFACGADVASDGTVYVAQCLNAAVYAVDPATGAASLVGRSPLDFGDNVLALDDGRVVLSNFFGGQVTVFTPEAGGGWSTAVVRVGR